MKIKVGDRCTYNETRGSFLKEGNNINKDTIYRITKIKKDKYGQMIWLEKDKDSDLCNIDNFKIIFREEVG